MKIYRGLIKHLAPDQFFVFTSNLRGFHGAGSAGYASFGVEGNVWRRFDYEKKPNGWKGRWNEKGVAEGFQEGTEGKSYAIPTVTKPGAKRSRTPEEITASIREFYKQAAQWPEFTFFVAQSARPGYNGYSPEEMAKMFSEPTIPDNVAFLEDFYNLMGSIRSLTQT